MKHLNCKGMSLSWSDIYIRNSVETACPVCGDNGFQRDIIILKHKFRSVRLVTDSIEDHVFSGKYWMWS